MACANCMREHAHAVLDLRRAQDCAQEPARAQNVAQRAPRAVFAFFHKSCALKKKVTFYIYFRSKNVFCADAQCARIAQVRAKNDDH